MNVPFNRTLRDNGCPCGKDSVNNDSGKGCTKRHVGCHGTCDEYKKWRAELDEQNKNEYLRRKAHDTMSEDAKKKMYASRRRNQLRTHHRSDER